MNSFGGSGAGSYKPVQTTFYPVSSGLLGGARRGLLGKGKVNEPWLSADDVAVHLGVTKDTVYTWIAEKGMPAHKIGRLWKFQAGEVDDWVRRGGSTTSDEAAPS